MRLFRELTVFPLSRLWQALRALYRKAAGLAPPPGEGADSGLCCSGSVHVAFRGLSDDRLYLSRGRRFSEVKYFKQNGLKVFCAGCRRRLI